MDKKRKSEHLGYGEGQREQYGEGHGERPENLTEGADAMQDAGWAGGDGDDAKATVHRPAGDAAPKNSKRSSKRSDD